MKIIEANLKKEKPCHKLGYCPYGVLIEEYPLRDDKIISCEIFGHDCPVFYLAEELSKGVKK